MFVAFCIHPLQEKKAGTTMSNGPRVNCYRCRFYYVTWEEARPNGCRALGFKSRQLPSIVVFRSSGEPCHYFKEKPRKRPGSA